MQNQNQNQNQELPDGGYGWVVVGATWAVLAVVLGEVYAFGVWLPVLDQHFNAGEGTTAMVGSVGMSMMMLMGFLNGPAIQLLGYRNAGMLGGCFIGGGHFLASYSQTISSMLLTFGIVSGVGIWLCMMPAMSIVNFWFTKRRATAAGIAMTGSSVGAAIFGPLIDALIQAQDDKRDGWRLVMRYLSIFSLVAIVSAASLYRLPSVHKPQGPQPKRKIQIDTLILKDPAYRVFTVLMTGCALSFFVPYNHIVKLALDRGLTSEEGATIVLYLSLSNFVGRFAAGFAGDRCGRLLIWQVSLSLGGMIMLLIPMCPDVSQDGSLVDDGDSDISFTFVWLVVTSSGFSFFSGAFVSMVGVLTADFFGVKRVASAMGMSMCFQAGGFLLGSPTAGWLREGTGDYRLPFLIGGVLFSFGGFTMGLVKPFLKHPEHLRQLEMFELGSATMADTRPEADSSKGVAVVQEPQKQEP